MKVTILKAKDIRLILVPEDEIEEAVIKQMHQATAKTVADLKLITHLPNCLIISHHECSPEPDTRRVEDDIIESLQHVNELINQTRGD